MQGCPPLHSSENANLTRPDPSIHPAGLPPLHSSENANLNRETRPQHTSCRTAPPPPPRPIPPPPPRPHPPPPSLSPHLRERKPDQTPAHILRDQTPAHILRDQTPAYILQDWPLSTAQRTQTIPERPDPSTHLVGLSPLHSSENANLTKTDPSIHPERPDPSTHPERPDPNIHPVGLPPSSQLRERKPEQRDQTLAHILWDWPLSTAQRTQT